MFRKRRRSTPEFKIPNPFNPIQGENANLRQDGTSPFCAMMQVAAEDTYADYVICRGFDTRILKFIDYAAGDANNPGICVAKPFGKRVVGTYQIAEIYPAFLPTQGNTEYSGFKQVTYVPPSPVAVEWRLGQNPGKVVGGGLDGGQPGSLTASVDSMIDHNGIYVNWILIDSQPPCSEKLEKFTMLSNWIGTNAAARFTLIEASSNTFGIIEDPQGIFTGQIAYGQVGLAIRTCSGRHFAIQAKCAQTSVSPPTMGCCVIPRSPGLGGDISGQTTNADCISLGGTWTAGACP